MRSPLKDPVLRLPGTYARDKIIDLILTLPEYFVLWACLLTLMVCEWNHFFGHVQYSPWIVTIIFSCYSVYLYFRFQNVIKDIKNYKLGKDGEVMVGQHFEGLRTYGYTPIHDVPCVGKNGKAFNIDHVLIGPKGIFVVETKTWSNVIGEEKVISFFNDSLFAGTRKRGDQEIIQTRNNAQWLSDLFEKRTGNTCEVFSILTFPGWFVDQEATRVVRQKYGVYTLSPKAIGKYIGTFDNKLSDDQIQYFVKLLSSYIYEQADLNLKN